MNSTGKEISWIPKLNTLEYLALEKGVQVLAVNRFYVGSKPEKPTIRLAVSAPNTLEELETVLRIIKELLDNYRRRKSHCPFCNF